MDEFDLIIQEIEQEENTKLMDDISKRCIEILKDAIERNVYDRYTPISYERTYQLINNLTVDFVDNNIEIFWKDLNYESNSGREVSDNVPGWVNYGHDYRGGNRYNYDRYEARNFLEDARDIIEKETGLKCTIIKDN